MIPIAVTRTNRVTAGLIQRFLMRVSSRAFALDKDCLARNSGHTLLTVLTAFEVDVDGKFPSRLYVLVLRRRRQIKTALRIPIRKTGPKFNATK